MPQPPYPSTAEATAMPATKKRGPAPVNFSNPGPMAQLRVAFRADRGLLRRLGVMPGARLGEGEAVRLANYLRARGVHVWAETLGGRRLTTGPVLHEGRDGRAVEVWPLSP